ncbi:hypothetical protein N0V90_001342 [Kalmusia sp. IMI 367209]|nr:hypothetical protein N0V90_001342 [Kalmusia sp. IMI 367209]
MPATLQPINKFACTYKGCPASFDTKEKMKSHKRRSDEHDYCHKCDEDFESYDDLARHKAFRPDKHGKACRVCGEEFKCTSGLRRHIELSHKVKQNLACLGCGAEFPRPSLFIEHLEFQFMGHVVHKNLITELLKGGPAFNRFMQKISKFDAALDYEEEGGVGLEDVLEEDEDEAKEVDFKAIEPECPDVEEVPYVGHYPPLPSQGKAVSGTTHLASDFCRMSLGGTESETIVGSTGDLDISAAPMLTSKQQAKPWTGRDAAKELFPQAKPTPQPPKEYTIESHDQQMENQHGINIMNTRFWDPLSGEWNPERFYNGVIQRYFCPFVCEQNFEEAREMRQHILVSHRVTRVKCPYCLKYFDSVTALMCHCESRGSKCMINKTEDFNIFLDKLTGGFLSVEEKIRPDHLENETKMIANPDTGRMEPYTPPTATYLKFSATKPVDWREPEKVAAQIGGGSAAGTFNYKNQLSRW